ncbi:hypothetical protein [Tsukamurella tyrosinosolvens]|uniref:hypothetical protein n=1 Tax=Tsukamurella tyrosinosolvens TaxID=57704 RepID=UPI000C7EDEE7|nr:hypothetical protein [Tsukamurella tyrosinosolvens]MEC4614360.1 hypothetical protein [Tsukamurella tyrosinosolvens]
MSSPVATLARRATAGPAQGFAVWSAAWLAGSAGTDELLAALGEWAPVQSVVDGDLPDLLAEIRALDPHTVRLLLPAPGDARGLPAGTDLEEAAMARGEVVLFDGAASTIALVPTPEAGDVMRWQAFLHEPALVDPDPVSLGAAEHALRDAVRQAPSALASLPPAPDAASDPRGVVMELTRYLGAHRLPLGATERAHRVLDSAGMVEAILLVAGAENPYAGLTLASAQGGDAAYRDLWRTVRAARVAAVNAVCREELRGEF